MSKTLTGAMVVAVLLVGAWGLAPREGAFDGQAQIGWSVFMLTQDGFDAAVIGTTLGGAAAYAGGEAGAQVGGFFGGIAGAAAGALLGAL